MLKLLHFAVDVTEMSSNRSSSSGSGTRCVITTSQTVSTGVLLNNTQLSSRHRAQQTRPRRAITVPRSGLQVR